MELGQLVDYCIEYNKQDSSSEASEEKPRKRKSTQADWDDFYGG